MTKSLVDLHRAANRSFELAPIQNPLVQQIVTGKMDEVWDALIANPSLIATVQLLNKKEYSLAYFCALAGSAILIGVLVELIEERNDAAFTSSVIADIKLGLDDRLQLLEEAFHSESEKTILADYYLPFLSLFDLLEKYKTTYVLQRAKCELAISERELKNNGFCNEGLMKAKQVHASLSQRAVQESVSLEERPTLDQVKNNYAKLISILILKHIFQTEVGEWGLKAATKEIEEVDFASVLAEQLKSIPGYQLVTARELKREIAAYRRTDIFSQDELPLPSFTFKEYRAYCSRQRIKKDSVVTMCDIQALAQLLNATIVLFENGTYPVVMRPAKSVLTLYFAKYTDHYYESLMDVPTAEENTKLKQLIESTAPLTPTFYSNPPGLGFEVGQYGNQPEVYAAAIMLFEQAKGINRCDDKDFYILAKLYYSLAESYYLNRQFEFVAANYLVAKTIVGYQSDQREAQAFVEQCECAIHKVTDERALNALHMLVANPGAQPEEVALLMQSMPGVLDRPHTVTGMTPIEYAAYYGNRAVFEFLLTQGANIDANEHSRNILDWLVLNPHQPQNTLGALPLHQLNDGTTELHVAAAADDVERAKKIMAISPQLLNAANQRGETPFYTAFLFNAEEVLAYFIEECSLPMGSYYDEAARKALQVREVKLDRRFLSCKDTYYPLYQPADDALLCGEYLNIAETYLSSFALTDADRRRVANIYAKCARIKLFYDADEIEEGQVAWRKYFQSACGMLMQLTALSDEDMRTVGEWRCFLLHGFEMTMDFENAVEMAVSVKNSYGSIQQLSPADKEVLEEMEIKLRYYRLRQTLASPALSPLYKVIQTNNVSQLKELVASGVDVNPKVLLDDMTVIEYAARFGSEEMVAGLCQLKEVDLSVGASGASVLEYALINYRYPNVVTLFANNRDKLYLRFNNDTTPLMVAAASADAEEFAQVLQSSLAVEGEACFFKQTKLKWTMLDYMVMVGKVNLIIKVVQHPAFVASSHPEKYKMIINAIQRRFRCLSDERNKDLPYEDIVRQLEETKSMALLFADQDPPLYDLIYLCNKGIIVLSMKHHRFEFVLDLAVKNIAYLLAHPHQHDRYYGEVAQAYLSLFQLHGVLKDDLNAYQAAKSALQYFSKIKKKSDEQLKKIYRLRNAMLLSTSERYGMICSDVPGDGNCFFTSMEVCLEKVKVTKHDGSRFTAMDLRELVKWHVLHNQEYYSVYIDFSSKQTIHDWMEAILDSRTWADYIVILALSRAMKEYQAPGVTICPFNPEDREECPTGLVRQLNAPIICLGYNGQHYMPMYFPTDVEKKSVKPKKLLQELVDSVAIDDFDHIATSKSPPHFSNQPPSPVHKRDALDQDISSRFFPVDKKIKGDVGTPVLLARPVNAPAR